MALNRQMCVAIACIEKAENNTFIVVILKSFFEKIGLSEGTKENFSFQRAFFTHGVKNLALPTRTQATVTVLELLWLPATAVILLQILDPVEHTHFIH